MVKYLFALLFISSAFACPDEAYRTWINPDGSNGGKVSYSARVDASVYIGPEAQICGRSWVDASVELFDQAQITDEAWVGLFVKMYGQAKIQEKANVRGKSPVHGVVLRDHALVQGHAKIHGKSIVKDNAVVQGAADIDSYVEVSASAIVCENVRLENLNISDDRFCLQGLNTSKAKIVKSGLNEGGYNDSSAEITFQIEKGYRLTSSANRVLVTINNQVVDSQDMLVWSDRIRVKIESYAVEGTNNLTYKFVDQFGRLIQDSIEFFVGSEELVFSLSIPDGTPIKQVSFRAYVWEGERKLVLPVKVMSDGSVKLQGLPDLDDRSVTIIGFGENSAGLWNFKASTPPAELVLEDLPQEQSLPNLDFSLGLQGWEHGGDGDVSVQSVSGEASLVFEPNAEGTLSAKAVFIKQGQQKVTSSQLRFSGTGDADQLATALMVNWKTKEFDLAQSMNVSGEERTAQAALKDLAANDKVVVFYQLSTFDSNKSFSVLFGNAISNLTLFGQFSSVSLLTPEGASVSYPPASHVPSSSCPDNTAIVPFEVHYEALSEGIKYLSTGSLPSYWPSSDQQSRIYGYFYMDSTVHREEDIRLEVYEDATLLASVPLSSCARRGLLTQTGGKVLDPLTNFNQEAYYLFELPVLNTSNAQSKLTIKLTDLAEPSNEEKGEDVTEISQLRDYGFSAGQLYSLRDTYDTIEAGANRGGGDTWGLEVYRLAWHEMLGALTFGGINWRVNDFSLMNGAKFRKTRLTHQDGQDGDFQYTGYCREKCDQTQEFDKGREVRESLRLASNYFPRIKEVYIEPADFPAEMMPEGLVNSGLWKALAHRCINGRVVDPSVQSGSLIRAVSPHKNHMHIRLHEEIGGVLTEKPQRLVDFSLTDFLFSLKPDGQNYILSARLRNPADHSDASDYQIAVRLQSDDVETAVTKMVLHSGPAMSSTKENYVWSVKIPRNEKTKALDTKFVKFVIWDKKGDQDHFPGGCQEMSFEIDVAKLCGYDSQYQDWYFYQNSDGTKVVVAEKNKVENSYITPNGPGICGENVLVANSTINAPTSISNSHGDVQKNEDEIKLEINNLTINNPSAKQLKTEDEPFVTIAVDGKLNDVTITTKARLNGDIEMDGVTMDAPASGDRKMEFENTFTDSKMIIMNTGFQDGYAEFDGVINVFGSSFMGDVKVNACKTSTPISNVDLCVDAKVVFNNVTVDSRAKSSKRDSMIVDVMSASAINIANTEVTGKPSFTEGLNIYGAVFEGYGSYEGAKAGALDSNGDPFLSALVEHIFAGDNDFKGHYYIKTNVEGSTISTLDAILPNGVFQSVIVDGDMLGKNLVDAKLIGNINVRGEVSQDIKLDSGNYTVNGIYLNTFIDPGSSIQGNKVSIVGPIAVWKNSRVSYTTEGPHTNTVTPLPTGYHTNIDYGSVLTDVELTGSVLFAYTNMDKREVSGTNNYISSSVLNNVTIGGTSCVTGRTWSNKSVSNFPCGGTDPLTSLDTDTSIGLKNHIKAINLYSIEMNKTMSH